MARTSVLVALLLGLAAGAAGAPARHPKTLIVAADGSGDFRTVQSAIDAAPSNSRARVVIRIRPGTYAQRVVVPPDKPFLTLAGDDPRTTIITGNLHAGLPGPNGRPLGTFQTPTVFIQANDFTAENLTFQNTAGPHGQAVALTILGDRGVFRNCRFLGYQDTLLAQAGRQYFDRCYIEGAVDFIFGGSAAWFDHCTIHVIGNGYITAPNTPEDQKYGYVFSHCRIDGQPGVKTYLSRPWRPWGATVYLHTWMSAVVRPGGWNDWAHADRRTTARYGEYRSSGPGGNPAARASWVRPMSAREAKMFTIESVLAGLDGWNPRRGTVRSAIRISRPAGLATAAKISAGSVWLAAVVRRDGGDVRLAWSRDGYRWTIFGAPLPGSGDVRRLVRGPDGAFYLLWAVGRRGDTGFHYAFSRDLVHWSQPRYVDIMASRDALNLESPEAFYNPAAQHFVVAWSSTLGGNAIQSFQEPVDDNPRVWFATTRDFETFSAPRLLFDNNYSVNDAVLVHLQTRYALVHADSSGQAEDLRVAFSRQPAGPWGPSSDAFSEHGVECPSVIRSGEEWWIYDVNTRSGAPGLLRTRDFWTFVDDAGALRFPAGYHAVSVIEAPRSAVPRQAVDVGEHEAHVIATMLPAM
jgi:pectinesterase